MNLLHKAPGPLVVTTPSDCEICITRRFNAPRALVFECWTKPELLKLWLTGPDDWRLDVCTIDFRPGGAFRYEWRNAADTVMGMGGVYEDIVAPELIVGREKFDQDWTGGETVSRIQFSESAGVTTLTQTILYVSQAARDGALRSGMQDGMEAGYVRLDEFLAKA